VSRACLSGVARQLGNQIAIDSLRTDLINKIWTGHGRPTNGVDSIAIIANPMPVIPANLLRVEHWTFEMYDYSGNFVDTSVDTVFWPKVGNGKLVLLAAGHGIEYGIWNKAHGYTDTASDLIDAGYTVVTLFMPFAGDVTEHNALPQPTSTINYLKFFVDPATRALNQTANQFSAAYMVGKSGGGWLTHLLAAIDTRIAKSVGIAGSMPLFISGNWPGKRDFEQFLPGLGVDYPDLYIIAADTGREQMQILNHDDPCCFTGSFYESLSHPYGPDIATATSNRWFQEAFHRLVCVSTESGVPVSLGPLLRGFGSCSCPVGNTLAVRQLGLVETLKAHQPIYQPAFDTHRSRQQLRHFCLPAVLDHTKTPPEAGFANLGLSR
jgi:hypothetical protein